MAKRRWDKSNPLYRWMQKNKNRKANKSPKRHIATVKKMAKRRTRWTKIRRRAKKMTIPIAPLIGIMATADSGGLIRNVISGDWNNIPSSAAWSFLGIGSDGKVNFGALVSHWTPTVAGLLIHKFVGGSPLNVNRTLANAGVPYIRV